MLTIIDFIEDNGNLLKIKYNFADENKVNINGKRMGEIKKMQQQLSYNLPVLTFHAQLSAIPAGVDLQPIDIICEILNYRRIINSAQCANLT